MKTLRFFILAAIAAITCSCGGFKYSDQPIRSGEIWPDDRGEHINAHGGGILVHEGTFYWFGEHKSERSSSAYVGVTCYSSTDLVNWKYEGVALAVEDDPLSDITSGCVLERPKVIYNEATGKFVMWFHLELKGHGYDAARAGVAISDNVTGPYTFLRSERVNAGILAEGTSQADIDRFAGAEEGQAWTDEWVQNAKDGFFYARDFEGGQMARDMTLYVDDDGKAYLSHGCAGSRAGVKSVLFVAPMSADGTRVTGPSRIVYDGHENQPTIEGTKFYKRNGYYYIMSPAGGVKYGWQVELRSRSPYGPYEEYVGMAQGKTKINGPHQGAWVDTQNGEHWFLHFQDKHAYGRVVHLQPAQWRDDWLVIGNDADGDGCGDPVSVWKKPNLPSSGNFQPLEDDDFDTVDLGLQWQFEGPYSHYWYFCDANKSKLRLYGIEQPEGFRNLSDLQNALLQKFPTENFTATAKIRFMPNPASKTHVEEGGFIIKGTDYAAVRIVTTAVPDVSTSLSTTSKTEAKLQYVVCNKAFSGGKENIITEVPLPLTQLPKPYTQKYAVDDIPQPRFATPDIYVRVTVRSTGVANDIKSHARFEYSLDGKTFKSLGTPFEVKEGRWIGAKLGFYNTRPDKSNDGAFLDIDWIHFNK